MASRPVLRLAAALLIGASLHAGDAKPPALEAILAETQTLPAPRGARLPLIVWTADLPIAQDDAALERTIRDLDARGIDLLTRWTGDAAKNAAAGIRVAKIEQKLGVPVAIECMGDIVHGIYDGSDAVAHHDAAGKAMAANFMVWQAGCPFAAIDQRVKEHKAKLDAFLAAYAEAGVPVDLVTADYEFDAPQEWNDSWAIAKQCEVCKKNIPAIATDFAAYQKAVRETRSRIQKEIIASTVKARFPKALVGVYGMNPNDGYRYWYDFFEKHDEIPGVAYKKEQGALYRPWAQEFDQVGYTLAMPVIYDLPHAGTISAVDKGFGWTYSLLIEGSSVGKSSPASLPIMPFVHWGTPAEMSESQYQEALWHLLLRGADGFCLWTPPEQMAAQIKPLQRVYGESLAYADFLDHGQPVAFDLPTAPGPVVSALKLGKKLLVRRTDFTADSQPASITVDGKPVAVPRLEGKCQVIDLP